MRTSTTFEVEHFAQQIASWELALLSGHSISCAMAADDPKSPNDPTPLIGADTDISRLGHGQPKPAHERTAAEDRDIADWERIASSEKFHALLKAKRRFVVPAMIFFIVYYFALLVLVGYARPWMETRVFGAVNLAYLFALSQFFMAWIIAWLYVRAAHRFDKMAREAIAQNDEWREQG